MNKSAATSVAFWCLAALLVVLAFGIQETSAVNCDVTLLSPCMGAVFGGADPVPECCAKLKEQVPCLCSYIKNPFLAPYVNSPNAKKTLVACRVPYPTC